MPRAGRTGLLVSTAMVRGYAAGRIVQLVQRLQRLQHALVGVSEVELVLAIVLQEECVGLCRTVPRRLRRA